MLNNASVVKASTRARGEKAIEELKYHPNLHGRNLAAGKSRSLAPRGWRADFDCIRYGCRIGSGCLVNCWALLLARVLSGHSVFAIGVASFTGFAERSVIRLDQTLVFGDVSVVRLTYAAVGLR